MGRNFFLDKLRANVDSLPGRYAKKPEFLEQQRREESERVEEHRRKMEARAEKQRQKEKDKGVYI